MHIETELDDRHAQRLLELQQRSNRPLSELVAEILARALDEQAPASSETEGQRAYRLLDEAGLIGCIEGDGRLSIDYKQRLWGHE